MKTPALNNFHFYKILRELSSDSNFYVAYSGGVDSQVLLHILHSVKLEHPEINITAIHIDHGLSINSKQWTQYCRELCQRLNIPCLCKSVEVKARLTNKHSKEALARELRYAAIAELLPEKTILLTAHHANDQAETLLLQLFRGSGPKGLAAIPAISSFGKNSKLIRPLLRFSRVEILEYAKLHSLKWIEDESNLDLAIDRNYVRLKLFPLITGNWLGALKTIGRSAQNCAEASELLDDLAKEDLLRVQGALVNTLSITRLLTLTKIRQRNVIRYWLRDKRLAIPSCSKLNEVLKTILCCSEDRNPLINWDNVSVRRYKDNLYAMHSLPKHDPNLVLSWDFKSIIELPSQLGFLSACVSDDLLVSNKGADNITIRFRVGGEKCRISGRGEHSHLLKHLFQEWQVPPWLRNRIPLIYSGDELICIVGYGVNSGWEGLSIKLMPADPKIIS